MQVLSYDACPDDTFDFLADVYNREDDDVEYQHIIRAVRNIINSSLLTERQRDCVCYRLSGYSGIDTAAKLGIAPCSVSKSYGAAIKTIKSILSVCFPRLQAREQGQLFHVEQGQKVCN
mgnify:CR=1 FL=1